MLASLRAAAAFWALGCCKDSRPDGTSLQIAGQHVGVRAKDLDSHSIKALLVSRVLLVKIKRDLENQIRRLLKNLGLVIGRAKDERVCRARRGADRGSAVAGAA